MPAQLSPSHAQLARLAGDWVGQGEVFPNPWGYNGPVEGRWRCRLAHGGFNLIQDYEERRGDGDLFEGHGVLTVDPQNGETVWFWFDSYGFPPISPARGGWTDDELRLVKTTPRGIGVSIFTWAGDQLTYATTAQRAGEDGFTPVMHGRFRRVG